MPREDHIEFEGTVEEAGGGGKFRIRLDLNQASILAQLSGKMRQNKIRVIPGDRVRVAVSPYDPTHGIITFRAKS